MSVEAISTVDSDLARVASAQSQLSAAEARQLPGSGNNPSQVEQAHAAVAAAEAALAAAQAALGAAQANQGPAVPPPDDPNSNASQPVNMHLVDTTA